MFLIHKLDTCSQTDIFKFGDFKLSKIVYSKTFLLFELIITIPLPLESDDVILIGLFWFPINLNPDLE